MSDAALVFGLHAVRALLQRQGSSVVQLLARDCPRGDQCPVWVEYPASTDLTAGRDVRVYGTVGGEQQFRSESGRTNTVPRIDAAFLVPAGG